MVNMHLDELLIPEGMELAVIGVWYENGDIPRAVMSIAGIIRILMMRDGMTEEDAWDWYYYNIEGAYVGENTPIYVYRIDTHPSLN